MVIDEARSLPGHPVDRTRCREALGWSPTLQRVADPDPDPDAVDVRRLRRSALASGLADGVVAVALPLLTAGLTREPLAVAGVFAAQQVPWVVVALARPALRGMDRRTTAGAGGSLAAVAVAVAGTSTLVGDETLLLLQVVALVLGTAQALDDDAQRVVGDTHRGLGAGSAHADLAAAGALGLGLLGLPLGGFLYEVLAPVPLLFAVGVFALAALLALSVGHPLLPATGPGPPDASWRLRVADGTGVATAAAVVVAAATGAVSGVLVLLALDDLGLGAPAFGLLLAGLAASAWVGAVVAPILADATSPRVAAVLVLVAGAAALVGTRALLDTEQPIPAALALGAATAAAMAAGVLVRVQLHGAARTPVSAAGLRAFHVTVWSATPAGALAGGLGARVTGVPDVLVGAALATLVAAVLAGLAAPRATTGDEGSLPPSEKDLDAPVAA